MSERRVAGTDDPELVYGARSIAKVLKVPERRAFYLLEKGYVPGAFKMGATHVLNVRVLRGAGEAANAQGS